jgi:hypothetical protein
VVCKKGHAIIRISSVEQPNSLTLHINMHTVASAPILKSKMPKTTNWNFLTNKDEQYCCYIANHIREASWLAQNIGIFPIWTAEINKVMA